MKSGAGGRAEFLLARVACIIVLLNLSAINNELVSTTQIQGKVVSSVIFGQKKKRKGGIDMKGAGQDLHQKLETERRFLMGVMLIP